MATKRKIQSTYTTTPDDIDRKWYIVDAQGQTLGRIASKITPILTGKRKPAYTPNLDLGDHVIIINSEKIRVTGKRMDQKRYFSYSGYPGGLTSLTLRQLMEKHPDRAIRSAVKGMLPKGVLGRQMMRKLRVYVGSEHPHEAQKPEVLEV